MVTPLDHASHRLGVALEASLDIATCQVAYTPGNTFSRGQPIAVISEENALHPSGDDDPFSDLHDCI
jgi:hypothetical protein